MTVYYDNWSNSGLYYWHAWRIVIRGHDLGAVHDWLFWIGLGLQVVGAVQLLKRPPVIKRPFTAVGLTLACVSFMMQLWGI